MGVVSLGFCFVVFVFLSSCASKLVNVDELDSAPKEYSQTISDLKANVVDQTTQAKAPELNTQDTNTQDAKSQLRVADPSANSKKTKASTPVISKPSKTWQPKAWPFGIGEETEYSLRYGVIEGGVVTMKTLPPKVVDGERALHYQGHVESTKLLELFYKVDNVIDSWVTMDSHIPIRQEIQQRESAQWGTRVVTFDRKSQSARFYATTEKKNKKKKVEKFHSKLDHYAQDVFSALYFFRFVAPQNHVNFAIHDRGKNWNNATTYLGTEVLDLPIGKIKARRYKLYPRISGHLKPKGNVEGWFADDETRVLVRFKATIKFGSIMGDLRRYKPGQAVTADVPKMLTRIDLNDLGEVQPVKSAKASK